MQEQRKDEVLRQEIDGDCYKNFKSSIVKFIHDNELRYIEGSIAKYVCRYRFKGGTKDLLKAKRYLELLLIYENNKNLPKD